MVGSDNSRGSANSCYHPGPTQKRSTAHDEEFKEENEGAHWEREAKTTQRRGEGRKQKKRKMMKKEQEEREQRSAEREKREKERERERGRRRE